MCPRKQQVNNKYGRVIQTQVLIMHRKVLHMIILKFPLYSYWHTPVRRTPSKCFVVFKIIICDNIYKIGLKAVVIQFSDLNLLTSFHLLYMY